MGPKSSELKPEPNKYKESINNSVLQNISAKKIKKDILVASENTRNSSLDLVYGIFLYTDEDVKVAKYIRKNLASFDKLTGSWSKIYIFEKPEPNIESLKKYWALIFHAQIYEMLPWLTTKPFDKSESYEIARQLNVSFDRFPCLVFLPPGKEISSQDKLVVPIKEVSTRYFRTIFFTLEDIVNQAHVKNKYEELKINFSDIIKYLENYSDKILKKTTTEYQIQGTNIFVNNKIRRLKMTENQNPKTYHQSGQFGIGHMSGGEIKESAKVAGVIHEAEQRNLADAVAEVQQILEQLSQSYPMETIPQKAVVAAEVVKEIEAKPTLKTRLINAGKEGGLAALEKSLDNVVGATIVGAIRGWQEVE